MYNGKLFPEGNTIELDEKEALPLSNYLDEVKYSSQTSDNPSLTNKEQSNKNKTRSK